ncbi:MAG: hypothetical protein HZB13_18435, partial [Acidobacteria bacterium]|nr:hypothetical protein [Acidobacteriota bacterium]
MRELPVRTVAAVMAVVVCGYFALMADGLKAGYFPDEMMNLHRHSEQGWGGVLTGLLLPWR